MTVINATGGVVRRVAAILVMVTLGSAGALLVSGCDQGGSGGHMMGGGMMGGGMMGRVPSANGDQTLPEPQSRAARLFQRYCGRCHALPSPAAHTAQEWPAVVKRMEGHMAAQNQALPEREQLSEILDYLQRHAG